MAFTILRGLRDQEQFRRAKLTMLHLRTASTLLDNYAEVHKTYPLSDRSLLISPLGPVTDPGSRYLRPELVATSLSRPSSSSGWPLAAHMRLERLKQTLESIAGHPRVVLETNDGWGRPILVGITSDGQDYVLASSSADGVLESEVTRVPWKHSEAWHDIILVDSVFISGPAGATW